MLVTWTGVRPGRERMSLEYGREVDDFFGKYAAEGKCTVPKWYFARTGPSAWIVEGELEELLMISATPEGEKLTVKGPLLNEGFTVELCTTERDRMFANFEGVVEELKIA